MEETRRYCRSLDQRLERQTGWRMWLDELGQDLRYSARGLAKSRGFTAVAVLSLAVGIGVNTAVFAVVDAMVLRPFPYGDLDRVVTLRRLDRVWNYFANPPVADLTWMQRADVFDAVAFRGFSQNVHVASDGHPAEVLRGWSASANLFETFGVQPLLGRLFRPEDASLSSPDVVILSHDLWQRRFGGSPTVIGETLWLDRRAATIVGVLPSEFSYGTVDAQFWVPARLTPADDERRIQIIARLAPGTALEQAQEAMAALAPHGTDAGSDANDGAGVKLVPWHLFWTSELRQSLFTLWAAVGFVLLIACANVAGVLLARASSRQHEVATRLALGASRWRVVRLFLGEGVLLALAAGALGSLLAYAGVQVIQAFNPDVNPLIDDVLPRLTDASVDGRVLGYTLLVSLATALVFSIAPALSGSKPELTASLKGAARGGTAGAGRLRLRSALVVAQVAMALVFLTGAGLMVSTMRNLATVDPGFNASQLLTFRISLSRSQYLLDAPLDGEPATELSPRVDAFFARVLHRIQTLPGVASAAGAHLLPLSHRHAPLILATAGHPAPAPDEEINFSPDEPDWVGVSFRAVLGNYFDVMEVPLLRGRTFTARDTAAAPWVVVVNRTMAETYWPNENPIGTQVTVARVIVRPAVGERPRTIVGVVEDVQDWSLQRAPKPIMFVPAAQRSRFTNRPDRTNMSYVLRTTVDPMSLAPAVQRAVAEIDPDQPVYAVHPMRQLLAIWTDGPRFYTLLTVVFAAVALLLSVIGIYGVMAYAVTQRTHEIGIRMTLGAARRQVARLVAGRGLALGVGGVALGLVGSFWLTRLIGMLRVDFDPSSTLLFGVTATDPATFATASLILLGAVLLACYGPTRRATKVWTR